MVTVWLVLVGSGLPRSGQVLRRGHGVWGNENGRPAMPKRPSFTVLTPTPAPTLGKDALDPGDPEHREDRHGCVPLDPEAARVLGLQIADLGHLDLAVLQARHALHAPTHRVDAAAG